MSEEKKNELLQMHQKQEKEPEQSGSERIDKPYSHTGGLSVS